MGCDVWIVCRRKRYRYESQLCKGTYVYQTKINDSTAPVPSFHNFRYSRLRVIVVASACCRQVHCCGNKLVLSTDGAVYVAAFVLPTQSSLLHVLGQSHTEQKPASTQVG